MGMLLRVLLVEDSEDDALLLVRMLRKGGYDPAWERVETPATMEAALDGRLGSHHLRPFHAGLQLVGRARLLRRKGFVDLPFIIVSGRIGEDAAVSAMKAGAHDYLMKDNLARLNSAIERELRDAEVRHASAGRPRRSTVRSSRTPSSVFQTTVDGRFLTANPAMLQDVGLRVSRGAAGPSPTSGPALRRTGTQGGSTSSRCGMAS